MRKVFLSLIAAMALAAVAYPTAALASPPTNDDFASAVAIDPSALPFTDSQTIDEATLEPGEPTGCYYGGKSVWYSITPATSGALRADISGSSFGDRILYVYRQDGSGFGGLTTIGCASPYYNGQSVVDFTAQAGQTYYLQAGGFYSFSTGMLSLSVQALPAPANDDFANATVVSGLPFSGSADASGATSEGGEPTPSCVGSIDQTVWYAYTPSVSGSLTASGSYYSTVAVYTGSGLGDLTQIACRNYGPVVTFHADAGTTYYVQEAPLYGQTSLQFQLDVAPQPTANFVYYPGDPSTFDTMQFYDQSYDPGQAGFSSEAWTFGDGTTASGGSPTHKYASDGDYTVKLVVTTTDGRTASTSQVVHVRTHDVAITKFTVPQSASAGQTRQITVSVANHRYDETVQVQLFKSVAGGYFVPVGSSQQLVPVRGGNRTTDFTFNYTFTRDDVSLGKVTFEATANLIGARDIQPTDNTAISLPTKVTK
jgi:PKD domain